MNKVSVNYLLSNPAPAGVSLPDARLLQLPETVLQFGTGVLLRGLPNYLIDKANRQGIFNGRNVVVKSTDGGLRNDGLPVYQTGLCHRVRVSHETAGSSKTALFYVA